MRGALAIKNTHEKRFWRNSNMHKQL